jgi:hypothetical protein
MKKIVNLFIVVLTLSVEASSAMEASKCLVYAQTYYEQLYCEISSTGRSNKLPNFVDFQKNSEITQALLLKPHAKALRIAITLPKRTSQSPSKSVAQSNMRGSRKAMLASNVTQKQKERYGDCTYQSAAILCAKKRFKQVTNRQNHALDPGALGQTNRLELPHIGIAPDEEGFEFALTQSYLLYLDKMMSIGLGGVTMTYTKFYYLYVDLLRRNVDFNKRFSTMFEFLKKDKRSLGVNNRPAVLSSLDEKHCSRARTNLFICQQGGRNYLFN